MIIWIFQTGEPLHIDNEDRRAMRCMNLADSLLMRGHQVRILSSRFYHQRKVHRKKHQLLDIQEKSLQYTLIDSPGYLSNISLARLFDHAVLAFNLLIYLVKESSSPHVCFIGSPPLEYAFIATLWAKVRGIPVILDVKDLWPEVIRHEDCFENTAIPVQTNLSLDTKTSDSLHSSYSVLYRLDVNQCGHSK